MKTLFSPPKDLFLHALLTLCIGFGCAWPLLLALDLAASASLCAACCAGVTLLYALGDCLPRLRPAIPMLLFAALAAVVLAHRGQIAGLSNALTLMMSGQFLALAAYSRAITALLCVLLTAVGASLARSEQGFFSLALLTVLDLLLLSFLGLDTGVRALLPLLVALLLSSRAHGVPVLRLLAMAALTLALTLACLPQAGRVVPALEALAEQAQRAVDDYLFFTEPRTAFSLTATGYQPLGQDQLGGPASPTDDPVMQVRTPSRALLRATVKNEYTGAAWVDGTSGRRYLFISPRFAQLRRDLFDQARPDASVRAMLPGARTLEVTMRADATSTLFLTQRFLSPKGEGIVSYFSPSSEVFATRSLSAGNSYAFSGRLLDGSTPGVRDAVLTAHDASDPYYDTVRNAYLQLPASVEPQVYQIAREITAGAQSDFDRAAALCQYLQRGFPYTLDQNTPPAGRDFVSWFLLEEKRGYCTSFASALAVLARAAGLPARYIEGYAAEPDSDGVARVTQQDGHAWTEIYFPGFGWLPFDATPGGGEPDQGGSSGSQDDAPDDPAQDPQQDPDQAASGMTPTPTPEPTPTPVPTPSPTPSPVPTPTPSPTPEHHDPAVTPTPEITPAPTPLPTQSPPPDGQDGPHARWPWLLLALLLLAALVALRLYLTAPARVAARYRKPGDQVLVWYRATQQALSCMQLPPLPAEPPASYLLRAQEALSGRVTLTALGKALCIARYSDKRLKPAAARKAEAAYRAVCALLTPTQRLRMHVLRFVRGIRLE